MNALIESLKSKYNLLPIKIKLFFGMLAATISASLAIYLALKIFFNDVDFWFCAGTFLAARVYLFMANPNMHLIDENVEFMSSERILWNVATIAVSLTMIAIKYCTQLII